MEADDDLDSLFAGMDFVSPLDNSPSSPLPESIPISPSSPHDLVVNGHLEESLLKPSSLQDGFGHLKQQLPSPNLESQSSIDSIMAAYDTVEVKPSLGRISSGSKLPVDVSKPGMRRKKRSLRIGYGRGGDDYEEPSQSRSSVGEQVASNGMEIEASFNKSNEVYEEAILTGTKTDIRVAEESNGLTNASNTTQAALSEHLEESNRDLDASDIKDLDLETDRVTLEDQATAIEEPDNEVAEAEELIEEASSRSEEPATASEAHEASIIEDGHGMEEAGTTNTAILKARTDNAKENGNFENECDLSELAIQVPSDYSIEERLEYIKKAVARNLQQIQQRIAAVSQARKAAAQKRRQLAENVSSTSAKFKEVEAELEVACEREDFERAENLSETLAVAERAREAALESFRATEIDYDKYASKMQDVVQMEVTMEEQSALLLQQLAQDASDAANQVKKDAEEKRGKEMDELVAEEESVKLKKKKALLELRVVEDANSELHNVIAESVEAESEGKKALMEERQVLLEELNVLLAAVTAKQAQIEDHDKAIEDIEEKISNKLAGFEKERMGLEADFKDRSCVLETLEKEFENLNVQKTHVEANMAQAEEEEKKLKDCSSVAAAEAQRLQETLQIRKSVSLTALSSKEKRSSLALEEKQATEVSQTLRSQAASLRTSLQELASERMKLHQQSLSASSQYSSFEKRIPEIETEKKVAAAARNFKEAGRLATEARRLHADKEQVSSDLNRISSELQKLDKELEIRMGDLSIVDNQLLEKEKEVAMARCERLRLLAAATRDERDAAAELEDFEEAESLHIEAEAADKEADELQKQYGFEGKVYLRSMSIATKMASNSPGTVDSKI